MPEKLKDQKAINLVTSQISLGEFQADASAHTVVVGYAPSMIRVIYVTDGAVDAVLMWYSTDSKKVVSLGATFEYVVSPISATDRGFILDLSGEEYPPDMVVWETYGFEPQESELPAEGGIYDMPGTEEDEYGL